MKQKYEKYNRVIRNYTMILKMWETNTYTIKPVKVVTYIKQLPEFKGQYFMIPNVHFNGKLTNIKYGSHLHSKVIYYVLTGCLRQVWPIYNIDH